MTTANKITIFRVILIPVFLVLMYLRFPGHTYWAFGVFVLASLSDFVDGYIARHYNQVTDFGKFMDPLADKLLVVAAMLLFVEQHQMPAWALLLVVAREFAVTGLRLIAVDNGRVIAAAWSGKDRLDHGGHLPDAAVGHLLAQHRVLGRHRRDDGVLRCGVLREKPRRVPESRIKCKKPAG